MPVRLMTLHAYGTWLPDRAKGYVHHQRGLCEQDVPLANYYAHKQTEPTASFGVEAQRVLATTLCGTQDHLLIELDALSVDPTHLHALFAWRHDRDGAALAKAIRHALTLHLNRQIERRRWFTHRGHLRPVVERGHFVYLRDEYIPSHRGTVWRRPEGSFDRTGRTDRTSAA